ncbi:MAG: UbiA family prenyltransferase [Euryarchaeota archaeon]|nr:UbiA family prenyltransferase [Euryarchaeota archaeon]
MEGRGTTEERFVKGVDRLAAFLEKDRLNLWMTFVYVLVVAVIRDLSEYFLLDDAFTSSSHPWIYSISHHVAFFVLVYLGLVLILKVFSGAGLKKCINYTSWYYWIILIPPWIDHFLFGQDRNYAYFSWTSFLEAFFGMGGESFHPGQGVEVMVVLFALFAYVFWRHRGDLGDVHGRLVLILRMGSMAAFTVLFMFIVGTPGIYIPIGSIDGIPVFPSFDLTRYYQYHLFIFAYYYAAGLLLVLVLSYITLRGRFSEYVRALRPFQTVFFASIVTAGVAFGWRSAILADLVGNILTKPYWVNLAFVVPTVLTAILAWQIGVLWNDISDRSTDDPGKKGRMLASGALDPRSQKEVSVVLTMVVLGVSLLLSVQQFVLMFAVLLLSYVYSCPPFRMKKMLLSPLLMGLGTFLAFLFGAMTPYSEVSFVSGSPYITGSVIEPGLTTDTLLVGAFMFLGLVIGSMVTDIDGYVEDRAAGVRTIYTKLGREQGTKVVAALVFLASLSPLVIFNDALDLLLFPVLGAMTALSFVRTRRSRAVMGFAAVGLIYAMARFLMGL